MKRLADPVRSYGGRALKVAPLGLGRAAGGLPRICRQQASHLQRPQGPASSPSKRPRGPGCSLPRRWVVQPSFFVFFFIVTTALHQETKLSASCWEMVPIYIGFQEINIFFSVPLRYSVRAHPQPAEPCTQAATRCWCQPCTAHAPWPEPFLNSAFGSW